MGKVKECQANQAENKEDRSGLFKDFVFKFKNYQEDNCKIVNIHCFIPVLIKSKLGVVCDMNELPIVEVCKYGKEDSKFGESKNGQGND